MVPIGFQITRSNHDLKYIVIWKCLLSILRDQTYHYGYPWLVDNPSLLLQTFLMKSWYFSVLPHGGGGIFSCYLYFYLPVLLLMILYMPICFITISSDESTCRTLFRMFFALVVMLAVISWIWRMRISDLEMYKLDYSLFRLIVEVWI